MAENTPPPPPDRKAQAEGDRDTVDEAIAQQEGGGDSYDGNPGTTAEQEIAET
jgi:hypothetical protein